MDDCLQIAHHRASDDPRRGAQRDLEILGRVPYKASDKQLHRWYVYSSREKKIDPTSIGIITTRARESRSIALLMHSADVLLIEMWN